MKADRGQKPLKHAPTQANTQLGRIHLDTYVGMAFSNAVAFSIILTAAFDTSQRWDLPTLRRARKPLPLCVRSPGASRRPYLSAEL